MDLLLGDRRFEVGRRALVMGILNRTPDSFFDRGAHFALDQFLRRAEEHVAAGADILDVGGVTAGSGDDVSATEEAERVAPAIAHLVERFDVPVSVDTWRAPVARDAFEAGAVLGNDISGFADPEYLAVAARAGASVVATHIRLQPRVPDPRPEYPRGVVPEVRDFLVERARMAEDAGISRHGIVIDAGLDLGKTSQQSLELLRSSDLLATLGYPLLLSASNKRFLGELLGLGVDDRGPASLAAAALGVTRGCRLVRTHDVRGTRRVVDVVAAVLEAA